MIENRSRKGVRANSYDKNAFFTLWFHSVHFCFSGVGIYKNNPGKTNSKETENTSTNAADKFGIGEIYKVKNADIDKINTEKCLGTSRPTN